MGEMAKEKGKERRLYRLLNPRTKNQDEALLMPCQIATLGRL